MAGACDAGNAEELVGAAACLGGGAVGVERGAAGAAAHGVRVVDREPGAHQRVDVVDLGAVDVLLAELVDHDRHAGVILEAVTLVDAIIEREAVAEAGAAATLDEEAQVRIGLALALTELEHLLRGGLGDRYEL